MGTFIIAWSYRVCRFFPDNFWMQNTTDEYVKMVVIKIKKNQENFIPRVS